MERPTKDDYYIGIAQAILKRSTCLKRRYGCVIVKDDIIIATGYNGSPRGEDNCCDMFNVCPRQAVPHNSGNYHDCSSVHAEQNALLAAGRNNCIGATLYLACEQVDLPSQDIWAYTQWIKVPNCTPCPICVRMIKNAGIIRVVNSEGDVCL